MIAYEKFESVCDNFGKFIHKFQLKTKTLIKKFYLLLLCFFSLELSFEIL